MILDHDFAACMEATFQADLAESDEISLEEREKRLLGNRLKERIAQLFKYWL